MKHCYYIVNKVISLFYYTVFLQELVWVFAVGGQRFGSLWGWKAGPFQIWIMRSDSHLRQEMEEERWPEIPNTVQGSTLCELVHLRMPFLSGREGEYVCISMCEREWQMTCMWERLTQLKQIVHLKMNIWWKCPHPAQAIQDVDECVSSFCSEWVPSEWESKQLIKTSQ